MKLLSVLVPYKVSLLLVVVQWHAVISSVAGEQTAQELGYGVTVYACDANLKRVPAGQTPQNQGSIHRVCFQPNEKATTDGVGIRSIDSFVWKRSGSNIEQVAVVSGRGDGVLSTLVCGDYICHLETMLGADFYRSTGSVVGAGTATMTLGGGNVEMKFEEAQKSTTGDTTGDRVLHI
jgi:hypothetical protein